MSGILVITEQQGGAWNRMSLETLAAGQQLAAELGQTASAAVAGSGVDALANELASKKLDRVYAVEHELLVADRARQQRALDLDVVGGGVPGVEREGLHRRTSEYVVYTVIILVHVIFPMNAGIP